MWNWYIKQYVCLKCGINNNIYCKHCLNNALIAFLCDSSKIKTNFKNIDYGGVKIHGPAYNDVWHQNKVQHTSPQYNKRSPRNKPYKQWVHEGTGVIFSKYAIQSLLQKHNWNENISEAEIKSFTKYVFQTCWYNDVLLSYEFDKLNIEIKLVNFFGIKGDR